MFATERPSQPCSWFHFHGGRCEHKAHELGGVDNRPYCTHHLDTAGRPLAIEQVEDIVERELSSSYPRTTVNFNRELLVVGDVGHVGLYDVLLYIDMWSKSHRFIVTQTGARRVKGLETPGDGIQRRVWIVRSPHVCD